MGRFKTPTTEIVDLSLAYLESELFKKGKHVINTDTLKEMVLRHVQIDAGNDETKRLADIGLGQVIQQRLYNAGYRSIRLSLFVNLDRCVDIEYLGELLRSADIAVEEKEKVRTRIRELRNSRLDGQLRFDEDLQVIVPINEDEFMERLLADAI